MGKADRKPLRKQDYGLHQWPSLRSQGNMAWYLRGCGCGSPRSLKCQRNSFEPVQEMTINKQAETAVGVGKNKKGPMIPREMIMHLTYFPRWGKPPSFQGKQSEETFSDLGWVRNRIFNLTGKILLHRILIQPQRKTSSFKSLHSKGWQIKIIVVKS